MVNKFSNPFSWNFLKALLGLNPARSTRPTVPPFTRYWSRVRLVSDRNLSAGLFRDSRRQYRLLAWRVYTDRSGKKHATTAFSRKELSRVCDLLQQAVGHTTDENKHAGLPRA